MRVLNKERILVKGRYAVFAQMYVMEINGFYMALGNIATSLSCTFERRTMGCMVGLCATRRSMPNATEQINYREGWHDMVLGT